MHEAPFVCEVFLRVLPASVKLNLVSAAACVYVACKEVRNIITASAYNTACVRMAYSEMSGRM